MADFSYICHFIILILTVHKSFSLSLSVRNLPFQQILPSIDCSYATGLTLLTKPCASQFCLISFFIDFSALNMFDTQSFVLICWNHMVHVNKASRSMFSYYLF